MTRQPDRVPRGWVWTSLDAFAEVVFGQSPPSSTYNDEGDGLPFYQGKLEFGDMYPVPRKWCNSPKRTAEKGDVLVSVRAPVGPTNICPEKSCIGRGLAAIRGLGGVDTRFILYLMRAHEHLLSVTGTGTTFNAITGDKLKGLHVRIPPLPEQHRIVAKIEELFPRLDAGVDALRTIKAQLKRHRQAVLKHAFEGKLTAEWREAHKHNLEPASVLLERIRQELPKNARGKHKALPLLDASDLPELPEGWMWARIGDISEAVQYGYTASATPEAAGPKLLRITDIQKNSVAWDAVPYCRIEREAKAKYLLKHGDLVFARTGATVGKSFLIEDPFPESVFASYLIRITFSRYVSKTYVYCFFQSHDYWTQIYARRLGIGQPNVNSVTLSRILVPLSPILEQHSIVDEIERCFSVVEQIERTVEHGLKQAERLRRSILKKAFEGELVPQDPNDEPAEILLERIREERAGAQARGNPQRSKRKKATTKEARLM